MKYQSRLEVASSILKIAWNGGATKTTLMNGSFLSSTQINAYLSFLLTNGLIILDEATRTYTITQKGVRFLHVYEDLAELSEQITLSEPVPTS
jgi:predicted transcriptional regulator